MLRTLGGRNIGKCRLRAHQHPLLPPLPNQRPHKLPPTYLQRDSFNERVLKMACCIHRFLISGSDLGINARVLPVYALLCASILDFRPKLGNRCKVLPVYALLRASILDFRSKLGNRCKVLPVYALLRASILDFKARLTNRCRVFPISGLLRASILDFRPRLTNRCSVLAAAARNGPPTVAVAATRSASDSILRCRKGERFRRQWP